MSPKLKALYFAVRRSPIGHCVSPSVPYCYQVAVTLTKWRAAARAGYVRLRAEFDPNGWENDDTGEEDESYGSIGEYTLNPESDDWEHGGSVWGHVGYRDVLDPFENPYILDIMDETLAAMSSARKASVLSAPHPSY
jgi:hypothetical protein